MFYATMASTFTAENYNRLYFQVFSPQYKYCNMLLVAGIAPFLRYLALEVEATIVMYY